jgi:hypothetical protein
MFIKEKNVFTCKNLLASGDWRLQGSPKPSTLPPPRSEIHGSANEVLQSEKKKLECQIYVRHAVTKGNEM